MRRILVGVDGSARASAALQWAVREAALRRWSVTAMLAWEDVRGHGQARACLDAAVAIAVGVDAARHVNREVIHEAPASALVRASFDADLLVVGDRGGEGFPGLLLGSVSEQCALHAVCPVAVIPATSVDSQLREFSQERDAVRTERIVVGIDQSDVADHALSWAVLEARLRHAELNVVHARPPDAATPYQVLDKAIAGHDIRGLPPAKRLLFEGSATAALLETASEADLVVVGSRGEGGFPLLRAGSVTRQLLHHATCPAVVVPKLEMTLGPRRTFESELSSAQ